MFARGGLETEAHLRLGFFARNAARAEYYVLRLIFIIGGAIYTSPPANSIRRVSDSNSGLPSFSGRVALVGHAYYPDLIGEMLACRSQLPADSDLIITTPPERLEAAQAAVAGVERVSVHAVPNRGRDVGPFLTLLNSGLLDPYAAVLKLHTKRSPHLRDGNIRRRVLFTTLSGSRRRVQQILKLFEDASTGLVGWGRSWRDDPFAWMDNRHRVEDLASSMGAGTDPDHPAFFEGTMFWVRPAALRRLRHLNLDLDAFEPEAGQLDGALHHALERIFALAVTAEGYSVRDLRGQQLVGPIDHTA